MAITNRAGITGPITVSAGYGHAGPLRNDTDNKGVNTVWPATWPAVITYAEGIGNDRIHRCPGAGG
jgi:hypothetical protein